jgi:hypothetical protein
VVSFRPSVGGQFSRAVDRLAIIWETREVYATASRVVTVTLLTVSGTQVTVST